MAKLEDITVGSTVKGIAGSEPVSIVAVQWYGSNVVEITYKNTQGIPGVQLLYRDDEVNVEVMANNLPWSFDADGAQMKLASEAYRIDLAHLKEKSLLLAPHIVCRERIMRSLKKKSKQWDFQILNLFLLKPCQISSIKMMLWK